MNRKKIERLERRIEANPLYPFENEKVPYKLENIQPDGHGNLFYRDGLLGKFNDILDSSNVYTIDNESHAILNLIDKYSTMYVDLKKIRGYEIAYTTVPKDVAKLYMCEQQVNLKTSLLVQDGVLGTGMYFSGLYTSMQIAALEHSIVLAAVLDLKNCFDLSTVNAQNTVSILKNRDMLLGHTITSENEFYNQLRKELKVSIDSIKGADDLICINNKECILKLFNPRINNSL